MNAAAAEKARRLEHVLWNPETHVLEWVVTQGTVDDKGKFAADGELLIYRIQVDDALMEHKGVWRRFETSEAVHVHRLFDELAEYAIASTRWWDAGKGEPVGPKQRAGKVHHRRGAEIAEKMK